MKDRVPQMSRVRVFLRGFSLFVLLVSQSGCFCIQTHESLQAISRPSQEFRKDFRNESANASVSRGICMGKRGMEGTAYMDYQFTNILAGPGARVLEILVAQDTDHDSRIGEITRPLRGGEPAFLLSQPVEPEHYSSPLAYFQHHYPETDPENYLGRSIQVRVDSPAMVYQFRKVPGGNEAEWSVSSARQDLAWVIRSRTSYGLSHLKYLFAVPLDVLTSPFQLFVFLVHAR